MGMRPEHICGVTYHGRHGSIKNAFRYRVDYVLTDLASKVKGPSLFSHNRVNVSAIFDLDHGGLRKEGRGLEWVFEMLTKYGFGQLTKGRILLLAQPRVWGHVFNPVSFWLIYDTTDVLRMVIAEVNNTYGDRHSYMCYHKDLSPILPTDRLKAQKTLHVSPFQPISGEYTFRFDITDEHVGVVIDYRSVESGVYATFHGRRQSMTNRSIVGTAVVRPLGSLRVLALIHWQAMRLWWKGASFRARPVAPESEVSS